ncbi:hypothetical protein V8E36_008769 [Tilletia maclaganii]
MQLPSSFKVAAILAFTTLAAALPEGAAAAAIIERAPQPTTAPAQDWQNPGSKPWKRQTTSTVQDPSKDWTPGKPWKRDGDGPAKDWQNPGSKPWKRQTTSSSAPPPPANDWVRPKSWKRVPSPSTTAQDPSKDWKPGPPWKRAAEEDEDSLRKRQSSSSPAATPAQDWSNNRNNAW